MARDIVAKNNCPEGNCPEGHYPERHCPWRHCREGTCCEGHLGTLIYGGTGLILAGTCWYLVVLGQYGALGQYWLVLGDTGSV